MDTAKRVYQASDESSLQYFFECWQSKDLFIALAWRNFLIRYKQAVFGVLWAVIRPLILMGVFTFVFSHIAGMKSGSVPYPLFVLAAMLPWSFFSSAVLEGANSLESNASLVTKIYCPRILIPLSVVFVNFFDLVVAFFIFIFSFALLGMELTPRVLFLPAAVGLTLILVIGIVIWFSALNVEYRDFKYVVPFVVQCGLYASPVGYSINEVPDRWIIIYSLNPMVGVIESFRFSLLGIGSPALIFSVGCSLFVSLVIFFSGFYYFRSSEAKFADVI
ncbi:MAG: ABC transporter permease [Bdellovibrionales bacterium]|nr:ABC transporter permease [Bdellovibrionales bacterium]